MSAASGSMCPGSFEWSAFGADYMDTYCVGGSLYDADSGHGGNIPCPFCDPVSFFDYRFGDQGIEPTCSECLARVEPDAVTFHDGQALTWTVACPTCETEKPALMREYAEAGDPR